MLYDAQGNKLLAPLVANMMNTRPTTTHNDTRRNASQRVCDFSHPDKVASPIFTVQPLRPPAEARGCDAQSDRYTASLRRPGTCMSQPRPGAAVAGIATLPQPCAFGPKPATCYPCATPRTPIRFHQRSRCQSSLTPD
jgi:hypothetical protein